LSRDFRHDTWWHHFKPSVLRREHVVEVIGKCAQSLYVLKLLRHHSMNDNSLRHVYKAVVLSKLLYASLAWWGFTCTADRQIEASVRRAVWSGLCAANDPSLSQLVADMDDNLFDNIRHNPHHVLHKLEASRQDHIYNFRPRRHSYSLTVKTDCRNFINRLLYKDIY